MKRTTWLLPLAVALATRATPVLSQDTTAKPSIAPATLAGVVHDAAGNPIGDAEVVVRETSRSVRTDAEGRFTLGGVAPGLYEVWFRKVGYSSGQFTWPAQSSERTDVSVALNLLPHTLDPVVVRAQEDKKMRGNSEIVGYVLDSLGQPVPEAEVQLIGADRTGLTRSNGGFAFRNLPLGPYLIRVRKMGYSPNAMALELIEGDEREVSIKIRQLPTMLDAVVINEQSGFGRDQRAWDDLEIRRRWHSPNTIFGPEELRRFYSLPLDQTVKLLGFSGIKGISAQGAPSLRALGAQYDQVGSPPGNSDDDESCILLNGKELVRRALRTFTAAEVEMLEVYPDGDPGGTIGTHMNGTCAGLAHGHTTWYVVWLRGAK